MTRTLHRGLAAAALGALALFAGACGGGGQSRPSSALDGARGETIRLWVMNNGVQPVRDTERILKPFEKRTGIQVKVELVGWDTQFDRIRNAAVSGNGPDVTQAGTTQVPFFAALGGFEDLTSRIRGIGGADGYADGVWKTTKVAGNAGTWAVPWFTEARAIYYRKDALREADVDPATAFTDLKSFRATLERLAEVKRLGGKAIEPFGGPGRRASDLVHNVTPYIWDSGGAELSRDNRRSTIDSPQAVRGVAFAADLVHDGLWDKGTLALNGQEVEDRFKGGHLATWMGGPWVLGSLARVEDATWSDAARANVGVAPMPAGPGGKGYTFVGGSNLMVLRSSTHKDAAWKLIEYLSTDRVQREYAHLMGMFPARRAPQVSEGSIDAQHEAFRAAIEQGRSFAPIPVWGQIENTYKDRFATILETAGGNGAPYDRRLIRSELSKAASEADALLARARR